jgi:hypothetical protein
VGTTPSPSSQNVTIRGKLDKVSRGSSALCFLGTAYKSAIISLKSFKTFQELQPRNWKSLKWVPAGYNGVSFGGFRFLDLERLGFRVSVALSLQMCSQEWLAFVNSATRLTGLGRWHPGDNGPGPFFPFCAWRARPGRTDRIPTIAGQRHPSPSTPCPPVSPRVPAPAAGAALTSRRNRRCSCAASSRSRPATRPRVRAERQRRRPRSRGRTYSTSARRCSSATSAWGPRRV